MTMAKKIWVHESNMAILGQYLAITMTLFVVIEFNGL